ncbi:AAA family ATPase [Zhaonella formicivorans]|uniref:AAA family ATPase n=1 Tax=Zhaonella formicivorans TaxID=2528593 RepID=UPI001D0F6EF0|nr:MoxR family ATPase [Zhaonella formicivorans]
MESYQELMEKFREKHYFLKDSAALVLFLAYKLEKPLLVEGPAGVGKTELAKVLADVAGARLIRLQCYEGLDESKALYEWNYQMQLLYLEAVKKHENWQQLKKNIYSQEFLLPRPLLDAIQAMEPTVLLIDELDKSDEEFESFLLELLAEFQISIPELGTIKAKNKPTVIITSNSNREFSEALKRRCFHLYLDYPDLEMETAIVSAKLPELPSQLVRQIVAFVQGLRQYDLKKVPSIAETLDWAKTILFLGKDVLKQEDVKSTLPILLKFQEDIEKVELKMEYLLTCNHSGER